MCYPKAVAEKSATGAPETEEQAIESLSQRLHFLLERYDPTCDPEWHGLTDHQKEIYRATVRGLLADPSLVLHLEPTTA